MSDNAVKTAEENYHALLMEYASGCMDEAHALLIATHMALSPNARKLVAQYEAIGGSILNGCCKPVAMKADALKCVMDRLENLPAPAAPCSAKKKTFSAEVAAMPACLEQYLESAAWKDSGQGSQIIHIKTTCSGSRAEIVRIGPEQYFIPARNKAGEVILVLQGEIHVRERPYRRGDLVLIERASPEQAMARAKQDFVGLVVRRNPSRLRTVMRRVKIYFCQ